MEHKEDSGDKAAQRDPFAWLEEIDSPEVNAFLKKQNKITEEKLDRDGKLATLEQEIFRIISSKDRLPTIGLRGNFVFNLWQDESHPRGIWRRASHTRFNQTKGKPQWETLLDIDALAKTENRNWVWHGATCSPDLSRCMVEFSEGGGDTHVSREWDMKTKTFVIDGFQIPNGKNRTSWLDRDTLLVGLTGSPEIETQSGYPRQVRLWHRGKALDKAVEIFTADKADFSAGADVYHSPEGTVALVRRYFDFFHHETFLLDSKGQLMPLELPRKSSVLTCFHGKLMVQLDEATQIAGKDYAAGSLLAFPLVNPKLPETVFVPTTSTFLDHVSRTRSHLLVQIMDNVTSALRSYRFDGKKWIFHTLPVPENVTAHVVASDPALDSFYLRSEAFLQPPRLDYMEFAQKSPASFSPAVTTIASLPQQFRSEGLVVQRHSATSADGTLVPYFVVGRDLALGSKPTPTLLYGYGGFGVKMMPFYANDLGKVWLEKGGNFVIANIRGGGEFGPDWHNAALKEHRQRAFDDFIAVAKDLSARKITTPSQLAIQGASNGGLLVGAVMVQEPSLFRAVVCDVPLLDMQRYHELHAGHSWTGEYGDPEENTPAGAAIARYSPYQNVKKGVKMPTVLFTTSTRDDRVHPGHARKMLARMQEQGHQAFLYENMEGGHSAAANQKQSAHMEALRLSFLWQELAGTP